MLKKKDKIMQVSSSSVAGLMRCIIDGRKGAFRMQARGTSMFPFIKDKDSITVQPFYGKQPCIGDIVAFERAGNNNLVIHRIVAKTGHGRYAVKGDNSKQIEICGYPGSIIGKINGTYWPGIPNYLVAMLSRFRFFEFIFRVKQLFLFKDGT